MAALAFLKKSFGNLKWTPETFNQINTKRCTIYIVNKCSVVAGRMVKN